MKTAIRWFPAFVGTFLTGFYVGSPAFEQATHTAKWCVLAAIVIATLIITAFLCAITRSSKTNGKQQSGGFGYATRTGRS